VCHVCVTPAPVRSFPSPPQGPDLRGCTGGAGTAISLQSPVPGFDSRRRLHLFPLIRGGTGLFCGVASVRLTHNWPTFGPHAFADRSDVRGFTGLWRRGHLLVEEDGYGPVAASSTAGSPSSTSGFVDYAGQSRRGGTAATWVITDTDGRVVAYANLFYDGN